MNRGLGFVTLFVIACIVGCGGGVPVQPVSGMLLLNGEPGPENTRINFVPVGDGMAASGVVDSAGKFELFSGSEGLAGALPGTYKVYVTADSSAANYMDSPQRGGVPGVSTGPFPKEYTNETTTPLKVEIVAGVSEVDVTIP